MKKSTAAALAQIEWSKVHSVTFYKIDQITTDLICCDVSTDAEVWTLHEEMSDWGAFLREIELLPGFRADWFAEVSQPVFAESRFLAFSR
ncbi:hypothetical protein [Sphingomonas psychrotolerans]|uniref:Uncharacterized protein n=1 Tax=Sphingomonas psychrotolerans TaxID=1327635 RepID=A0A2K8MAH5_9SPHN|nr:hypothetical protein [Sphingomonas psychrotolerans]ATY30857.1 hypothetical protein CVN68_01680 [Sphingomonas psychrotolerans]